MADDDDLTFSQEYRESEADMLIPAREADFRAFLCSSGAAEEIVRLLVGLAEAGADRPEDPVAFLRAKFDSQELPEMVSGRKREDIPALIAENEALHTRASELHAQVEAAVGQLEEVEGSAHAKLLDSLLSAGTFASDGVEGALDVGKLHTALSARFPTPAEESEASAETAYPWILAEGAVAPSGTATANGLRAWAKAAFGYGTALLSAYEGLSLQLLISAAGADEACEIDVAKAAGLHEACVLLVDFTEEAAAVAAEGEAAAE